MAKTLFCAVLLAFVAVGESYLILFIFLANLKRNLAR